MTEKAGRALETLVRWIETTVSTGATVRQNVRVEDRDTGQSREIDVVIEYSAGHHKTIVMGEVRDRDEPADVTWIEQVHSKLRSVGADKVFLVSRAGFSGPALRKALAWNITPYTLDDATAERWDKILVPATVSNSMLNIRLDAPVSISIAPVDRTGRRFWADHDTEAAWIAEIKALPDQTKAGKAASNSVIARLEAEAHGIAFDRAWAAAKAVAGGDHTPREGIFVEPEEGLLVVEVPMSVPTPLRIGDRDTDTEHDVVNVIVIVRFPLGPQSFPITLMRYREPEGDTHAIVASALIEWMGMQFTTRLILPGSTGEVAGEKEWITRLEPTNDLARRLFKDGDAVYYVTSVQHGDDGTFRVGLGVRFIINLK